MIVKYSTRGIHVWCGVFFFVGALLVWRKTSNMHQKFWCILNCSNEHFWCIFKIFFCAGGALLRRGFGACFWAPSSTCLRWKTIPFILTLPIRLKNLTPQAQLSLQGTFSQSFTMLHSELCAWGVKITVGLRGYSG